MKIEVQSARAADRDAMLATVNEIHRIAKGRAPTVATDFPHVYDPANLGNVLIIRDGERVAASVAVWINEVELGATRLRIGGINCLVTLPAYRRQGLGRVIMEAAHQHMRALGCRVGLLGTQIKAWYRKLGWECAGVVRTYHLDDGNIALLPDLPAGVRLRTAGAEALPDVLRLRAADRLGGRREADTFAMIYAARGCPTVVLAEQDGGVAAYLLAKERSVVEWGGPGEFVAALLRAWFDATRRPAASTSARGADSTANELPLTVPAPASGHDLVARLERLRIPSQTGYGGLLYLLDPAAVLAAFGHDDIEIDERDGLFALRREAQTEKLARRHLTKLFFGPERVSDFAADIFPLPFWQWALEHV